MTSSVNKTTSVGNKTSSVDNKTSSVDNKTPAKLTKRSQCPHQQSIASDEPCLECQNQAYENAKHLYALIERKRGLDDTLTLTALFNLFDQLIIAYRLTECEQLLNQNAFEACARRGRDDQFYLKMIQARAFLCYKQSRFQECVQYFEEMMELMGPNDRILENVGHAYNAVGQYDKAASAFKQALELISQKSEAAKLQANEPGVLLGLGMVKKHQGKFNEALPILQQAYKAYRDLHTRDHSLVAKAGGALASTLEELERLDEAEQLHQECVRIFRVTCGDQSPLTANALHKLGNCQLKLKKDTEAKVTMTEALQRGVEVDVFSVCLRTVAELLTKLAHMLRNKQPSNSRRKSKGKNKVKKEQVQETATKYVGYCEMALEKLHQQPQGIPDNGDSAIFYKTLADLCVYAHKYDQALLMYREAERIFGTLVDDKIAESFKNECTMVIALLKKNV